MGAAIKDYISTESRKRKSHRNRNNTIQLWLMCAVPMILVFIFCYLPMFGLVIAFKDYRFDLGIWGSKWIGLDNFRFFIGSNDFYRVTRNTLGLNAVFIFTGLAAQVIVALMLFEIKQRTAVKTYQTILIMPSYLSWVVVGYMAYAFLNPNVGYINSLLKSIGLEPIDWYSNAGYWPYVLAIFNLWKGVGLGSVQYYACLMSINTEYFEAAALDGAGKLKTIWYIVLPHLRTLMIILTTLNIGGIFRCDFGMFYQLTRDVGALYATTDVIDTYIFRVMRSVGDMSLSTAVGFLQSVVGFVMIVATNLIVRKIDPDSALF